jgi:hypothetical protein
MAYFSIIHASSTIERMCFLRGSCREVILKITGAMRGGFEFCTVALRVVGGGEKVTQCLGV